MVYVRMKREKVLALQLRFGPYISAALAITALVLAIILVNEGNIVMAIAVFLFLVVLIGLTISDVRLRRRFLHRINRDK
jgi:heme exporter protein D